MSGKKPTILELNEKLRLLHGQQLAEKMDEEIDLAFKIMEGYTELLEKKIKDSHRSACCYAALVVSGFIKEGLADRTKEFLREYEDFIHPRAAEILRASMLRMSGF